MAELEEQFDDDKQQDRLRRTVFIPVVAAGSAAEHDELIKVYAQSYRAGDDQTDQFPAKERKALSKGWPLVAAPLRQTGSALFQAGCAAVSAVRTLAIATPSLALYQRLRPQAWLETQRLHAAGHRGPSEGTSAQLGLAAVLLMGASATRQRQVIATGALSAQCGREFDTRVMPVGRVAEKMRRVIQGVKSGEISVSHEEMLFFAPLHYLKDGAEYPVQELPEVAELASLGVRVQTVQWLSEVAEALGAQRTRYLFRDRLAQAAVAGIAGLALVFGAWFGWAGAPVPMGFVAAGNLAQTAQPFQACFQSEGSYFPVALQQDGLVHSIPQGETLGWRLKIGNSQDLAARVGQWLGFDGYYVAVIMVAEYSPAKVVVPRLDEKRGALMRIMPGRLMEWGWRLNQQQETNGLVVLARRDRPFDADRLRERLIERFPQAAGVAANAGGLDVTAAVNFVSKQAPGAAWFVFKTVEARGTCLQQVKAGARP